MKICIEYDTVTKQMTASMDGQPIEDFSEANFSKYTMGDDEAPVYAATIRKTKRDKVHKTHGHETVYASHSPKLKTNLLKDLK